MKRLDKKYWLLIVISGIVSISTAYVFGNSFGKSSVWSIPPVPPIPPPPNYEKANLPPPPPKKFPPGYTGIPTPQNNKPIGPPPSGYQMSGGKLPSGYKPTSKSPPIPPVQDELKNFPIDLDLNDFHEQNKYPIETCYFPIKGKKDAVIEYIGAQEHYTFPNGGTCNIEQNKCYLGKMMGDAPFLKPEDAPIAVSTGESMYLGWPVIPYEYPEKIDFTKCMPTRKGYLSLKNHYDKFYSYRPKRDYSKQNCYHLLTARISEKPIFCDAERCAFPNNEYCEHATGKCYKNDYLLKNKSGRLVTSYEDYSYINWDWCLNEEGAIIPEDGGPPYEERLKPGCSYRITAKNYHDTQYGKKPDFLIKCDDYRCMNPGFGEFHLKDKNYFGRFQYGIKNLGKTPHLGEFLTIDWTCLDAEKVRDFPKRHLCMWNAIRGENPDCQLCYENKKFVYKNCKLPYDEVGRRTDIPEAVRKYDFETELKRFYKAISLAEIPVTSSELDAWLSAVGNQIERALSSSDFDDRNLQMVASFFAEFSTKIEEESDTEEAAIKLKKQLSAELHERIKKNIDQAMEDLRKGYCHICNTSTNKNENPIAGTCYICKNGAGRWKFIKFAFP